MTRRAQQHLVADAALVVLTLVALAAVRRAGTLRLGESVDGAFSLDAPPAFWLLGAAAAVLMFRMMRRLAAGPRPAWRDAFRRWHDDSAAAAVPFLMCLPIFLIAFSIVLQLALSANAAVVAHYAAWVAARSAIVCLPEGEGAKPATAAAIVLSGISPASGGTGSTVSGGRYIERTLQRMGVRMPDRFEGRFSYARANTRLNLSPSSISSSADGRSVAVTLTYKFKLTIPYAGELIGQRGKLPIQVTVTLRSSPGPGNRGGLFGTLGGLFG